MFETTNQIIHGQSVVVRKKSCSSFALWLVTFHFVQMFFWIFWRRRFCDLFFSLGHFSLLFGANISHLHCASIFRGDKQFFRVTRFFHRVTRFFHLNMYIDIYTERRLRHNPVGCIGCEQFHWMLSMFSYKFYCWIGSCLSYKTLSCYFILFSQFSLMFYSLSAQQLQHTAKKPQKPKEQETKNNKRKTQETKGPR